MLCASGFQFVYLLQLFAAWPGLLLLNLISGCPGYYFFELTLFLYCLHSLPGGYTTQSEPGASHYCSDLKIRTPGPPVFAFCVRVAATTCVHGVVESKSAVANDWWLSGFQLEAQAVVSYHWLESATCIFPPYSRSARPLSPTIAWWSSWSPRLGVGGGTCGNPEF